MSFEEIVRKQIAATPFSDKLARNVLKVLLGEIQQKSMKNPKFTDDMGHNIVKGLIKSNEENIGYLEVGDPRAETFRKENEVLQGLLPTYWSVEQIRAELLKIEATLKDKGPGPAMGLAMKHLKGVGAPVEGDSVKVVVYGILGTTPEAEAAANAKLAKSLGF